MCCLACQVAPADLAFLLSPLLLAWQTEVAEGTVGTTHATIFENEGTRLAHAQMVTCGASIGRSCRAKGPWKALLRFAPAVHGLQHRPLRVSSAASGLHLQVNCPAANKCWEWGRQEAAGCVDEHGYVSELGALHEELTWPVSLLVISRLEEPPMGILPRLAPLDPTEVPARTQTAGFLPGDIG